MSSKFHKTDQKPVGTSKADQRRARLAEALRANLHKRKAQARARQAENKSGPDKQDPKDEA